MATARVLVSVCVVFRYFTRVDAFDALKLNGTMEAFCAIRVDLGFSVITDDVVAEAVVVFASSFASIAGLDVIFDRKRVLKVDDNDDEETVDV
jgi:hypothetical protein